MNHRGIEALKALDPGGVKLVRGVHMLVVGLATAAVCHIVADVFEFSDPRQFGSQGAVFSIFGFFLSSQGTRQSETTEFLRNFGIAFVIVALSAAVGWGDLGYGGLPVELAWVVVIAISLYVRRYGPTARRYGLMAAFSFMFITLLNPTRDAALWLMLDVVIATVVTMIVHNLLWRPSPTTVYRRQVERFLAVVADELGSSQSGSAKTMPYEARRMWEQMVMVAHQAAAEKPQERRRLQQADAAGLHVLMALQVVRDAVRHSDHDPPDVRERRNFDRLYDDTIAFLVAPVVGQMPSSQACEAAFRAAGDDLIADRDLERGDKYQWLRQLIGLLRVVVATKDLRNEMAAIGTVSSNGERSFQPKMQKGDPEGMGWRLALQGFVAAGIAATVGFVFDFSHAYWATMSVFLVLCASLGATIKRTLERAVGTAIGVLVAVAIQPLIDDNLVLQVVLVCLASIPFFILLERHYLIVSGLIGFLVVIALHFLQGIGVEAMESRLYLTGFGAGLALLAAWLVFPIRAKDHVRPLVDKLLADCRAAVETVMAGKVVSASSHAQLNNDSQAIAAELIDVNSERFIVRHRSSDSSQLQVHVDALVGYLALYLSTVHTLQDAAIPDKLRALEDELVSRVRVNLTAEADGDHESQNIEGLIKSWRVTVPLDGSAPVRDVLLVVEELFYARKLIDTATGLRRALAGLHI